MQSILTFAHSKSLVADSFILDCCRVNLNYGNGQGELLSKHEPKANECVW